VELLRWFAGSDGLPRFERELLWGCGTLVLSIVLAAGYVVIAFNWYLQRRIAESADAKRAARRLAALVVACVACGAAFYAVGMPWWAWRGYDLTLLLLTVHTWTFVLRMRGLSLVDEPLAEGRELQRSVDKYREMSEYLPHMVWTADDDGSIDFSNVRWMRFVGGNGTWLQRVHPDDRDRAVANWETAVARREPVSMEVRVRGLDGYRTFLLTATPLVRSGIVRWLGACADIEDQKQLAAERERQSKQRVFMLNALGHDLRAPLNAVALNSQLLKMSAKDPEVMESATAIADGARSAGALVTELLEYARVGARDENELTRVAVSGLLGELVKRFGSLAGRKGLTLRVAANDFDLVTDRMKLERILSNLVENAVKFTDKGVIAVEAIRAADDAAVFQVSDTGRGVPEPHVPYLFNEFYQVNNHERDHTKGFGMGLAICRCLARQLGGDVRLVRTGAAGSTFELTLPGNCSRGGGRPSRPSGLVPHPADATV
jgi:PAS domain S-box-containing protein